MARNYEGWLESFYEAVEDPNSEVKEICFLYKEALESAKVADFESYEFDELLKAASQITCDAGRDGSLYLAIEELHGKFLQ